MAFDATDRLNIWTLFRLTDAYDLTPSGRLYTALESVTRFDEAYGTVIETRIKDLIILAQEADDAVTELQSSGDAAIDTITVFGEATIKNAETRSPTAGRYAQRDGYIWEIARLINSVLGDRFSSSHVYPVMHGRILNS